MPSRRSQIQDELRGLIAGEVLCDPISCQNYSSDASLFQVEPIGVARPKGSDDVQAIVDYAKEQQIPLIARGSGSGLAGESLGAGIIVDFSTYMNNVKSIGTAEVTVEPGTVIGSLNNYLRKFGKQVAFDPSTRSFSTVGGAVARDSIGSRWKKYGSIGDQVTSLKAVLAEGALVQFGRPENPQKGIDQNRFLLEGAVYKTIHRHKKILLANQNSKPQPGYRFSKIDLQQEVDLLPLMIASEGTLGLFTEVTLKTEPVNDNRGVVLLFFSRITDAAAVSLLFDAPDIIACELMDRRLLSMARDSNRYYKSNIPIEAEAMLLLEVECDRPGLVSEKLKEIVAIARGSLSQSLPFYMATEKFDRDQCWHLVRRIIPTLYRLRGSTRAVPFVEDIYIPPQKLPDFLITVQNLFNRHHVTVSIFAHTQRCILKLRPFVDIALSQQIELLRTIAEELYQLVWEIGGSIGLHGGMGISRSAYLKRQAGSLAPIYSEIKRIFDPRFLLNPDKIVTQNRPESVDLPIRPVLIRHADNEILRTEKLEAQTVPLDQANGLDLDRTQFFSAEPESARPSWQQPFAFLFRSKKPNEKLTKSDESNPSRSLTDERTHLSTPKPSGSPTKSLTVIQPEMQWDPQSLTLATRNCNGCGRCRSEGSSERMCPMFRAVPSEESSPRSKANLLRSVMTGQLPIENLASDEMKWVTDSCINCHQCRTDCPAGVDIPKIVNELRSHYWNTNGLTVSERILTRLDILFRVAHLSPMISNFLIASPWSRWILEKVLKINQNRKLPRFHTQTFQQWAASQKLNKPISTDNPSVVFFTDAFVNWNDPELGIAMVKVLQHNHIDVWVPPGQRLSGLSLISSGAVGPAKKIAKSNVKLLATAIRSGAKVITTEPAAALALKHEYLNILSGPDAKLVAENTMEATEYLWSLHQNQKLDTSFDHLSATLAHHLPCHQRSVVGKNTGLKLLNLIPGLKVFGVDKGCSGMAGIFGLFQQNYWRSLKIGSELLREIRSANYVAGTTECSTCRMQMEQGTEKPTIHPIKILALAYNLMPELENLFQRKGRKKVLS